LNEVSGPGFIIPKTNQAYGHEMKKPATCVKISQKWNNQEDITVPGGIYLCQVSESVSCGACCGLYNLAYISRDALINILEKRTCRFAKVPREVSEIIRFGETVCGWIQNNQPFSEFHHCPYVGLIGNKYSRVGCLLHPLAEGNKGIDFRGLSYYGGMACRIYFCPVNRHLPQRIKNIVQACFDDWYEYGLIITEKNLIAAVFQEIEMRLENPVYLHMISPEALSKIYQLLTLKLNWQFRSPQWPIVNYFFEDRKYRPPVIDYQKIGVKPSCYHDVLQELGSKFPSAQTMYQAENILDTHFDSVIEKISSV
jgi:hypothetical protein